MVDKGRVRRLLRGIEANVAFLARFADRPIDDLVKDELTMSGIKYRFVTAIEGCAKVAHHLGASEEWPVAETNADAVRMLATEGVLTRKLDRRCSGLSQSAGARVRRRGRQARHEPSRSTRRPAGVHHFGRDVDGRAQI